MAIWNLSADIFCRNGNRSVYTTALIVPFLMAKVMSASMAIKLCVVMTVVVLYLSIYRLCSRFSIRSIASISAFVVVLGVMNSNVFKDGMWYNFLSISFSAYFIYWLDSYLYHSTKLNLLRAIFFWVLAIYTHPIGNVVCGIYWLISLIVDRRKIAIHCVILVIVVLLGGPQIWALLQSGAAGDSTRMWPPIGLSLFLKLSLLSFHIFF